MLNISLLSSSSYTQLFRIQKIPTLLAGIFNFILIIQKIFLYSQQVKFCNKIINNVW